MGVISFLLIVYYNSYERVVNGLFTIFQNRLGDLFFIGFILGLISLNSSVVVLKFGVIFLIFGACVKRAQFPFNLWLLAAIRAPTPISSLVHSSTLVVAGVFILLQYSYCLTDLLYVLKYVRFLTLVISCFGLLNEPDIKKLIAYSTMSHVALIMYLIRLKLFKITYFHLNIHAMFKSLIFICFGFSMLCSFHAQDKRLVSYNNLSPILKIIYYYACLSLAGLPFLTGFFSKDFIVEKLIEIRGDMRELFSLLIFLRIRIYYRLKLLILYKAVFPLSLATIRMLRMVGVGLIVLTMTGIVNLFISLIVRVTLEIVQIKIFIYLLIRVIALLALLTNLNYKWQGFSFKILAKEI